MMESLSYRNQSIDLLSKTMDWFLYDMDFRHERVKEVQIIVHPCIINCETIENKT